MGRVSKHKKIKSFDPFYKGTRRAESSGDNLAPANEDDQPVPKSLIRLMKSASRPTPQNTGSKQASSKQKQSTTNGAAGSSRVYVDTSLKDGDGGVVFKRRRGESLKSYLERIDVESNERIMEAHRKNRRTSERRKKYLNERKKRLKARKSGSNDTSVATVEFNDFKDVVKFGEVADAPPQLSAKPRGTEKKSKGERLHSLLLHQGLEGDRSKEVPSSGVRVVGLKRKHDLELEREKAVELYRQSKRTKMCRTSNIGLELRK